MVAFEKFSAWQVIAEVVGLAVIVALAVAVGAVL